MAKEFLNPDERAELKAKYKAKLVKDAPHNITDATLISQFGSDEQKARLPKEKGTAPAPAKTEPAKPAGTEAQKNANETAQGSGEQKGTEPAKDAGADNQKGDGASGTEKGAENVGAKIPSGSPAADPEYISALNQYIALNDGKAPENKMTTDELKSEIAKIQEGKQKQDEILATQKKATDANVSAPVIDDGMVTMVNKKTGDKKRVNRVTYDRFLKNDSNYELAPEVPAEVQALRENG